MELETRAIILRMTGKESFRVLEQSGRIDPRIEPQLLRSTPMITHYLNLHYSVEKAHPVLPFL